MKLGTFNKPDYLCIGPYAWARSKSPRDAYTSMKGNMPKLLVDKDKAKCQLWRLTDNTDVVRVDDHGGFNIDCGETPFPCGTFVTGMPPKYILDDYPVPSNFQAV